MNIDHINQTLQQSLLKYTKLYLSRNSLCKDEFLKACSELQHTIDMKKIKRRADRQQCRTFKITVSCLLYIFRLIYNYLKNFVLDEITQHYEQAIAPSEQSQQTLITAVLVQNTLYIQAAKKNHNDLYRYINYRNYKQRLSPQDAYCCLAGRIYERLEWEMSNKVRGKHNYVDSHVYRITVEIKEFYQIYIPWLQQQHANYKKYTNCQSCFFNRNQDLIEKTIQNNHMDCLEKLYSDDKIDEIIMQSVKHNNLQILTHYTKLTKSRQTSLYYIAVKKHNLDIFIFLHQNDFPSTWSFSYVRLALEEQQYDIVKYILTNGMYDQCEQNQLFISQKNAIIDFEIIMLLQQHGFSQLQNLLVGIMHQNADLFRQYVLDGIKPTRCSHIMVVENNLEMLKFCVQHGDTELTNLYDTAVINSQQEIIDYCKTISC